MDMKQALLNNLWDNNPGEIERWADDGGREQIECDSWRGREVERLASLAGLDEGGAILPPPLGMGISREPSMWWRSTRFG